MHRALFVASTGRWPAEEARDSVTLAYDDRHRRRIVLATDAGDEVLLDLPRAIVLAEGDGLALEDGGWVAVRAAPEDLLEVTAAPGDLLRLAWHIGNRHTPAQLLGDSIRIRADHVLADMLASLGATVRPVHAPFTPEGGAYAGAHSHG